MNTFVILCSLAALASAKPQYGGGSAGGLLGHSQALNHQIIGLSGGIEDKEEDEGGYRGGQSGYGQGGGYGGGQGGGYGGGQGGGYRGGQGDLYGGGLGGGLGGGNGGEGGYGGGDEGGYGGGDEGGKGYDGSSIGFTGSDFKTPVDIHHEKEIHLKAKPVYHYDYHVADHKHKDFKSKHEIRDGYKVKGSYSLLEPDHKTIRVVDYVSDKKLGFIIIHQGILQKTPINMES